MWMLDKNLMAKSIREASEKARSDTDTKDRGWWGGWGGSARGRWGRNGSAVSALPSSAPVKYNYMAVDPAQLQCHNATSNPGKEKGHY